MPALNALTPRTRLRHAHHTKPPILVSLQQVTLRDDFGHPPQSISLGRPKPSELGPLSPSLRPACWAA